MLIATEVSDLNTCRKIPINTGGKKMIVQNTITPIIDIFADGDYIEKHQLWGVYSNVSDPISNTKGGDLTLWDINYAFTNSNLVKTYELVIDGQVIKGKVDAFGAAVFKMPKNMTSGEKNGVVYAVDAAGKRSEGIEVHFDVDDKVAPKLTGKLGVVQSGNDFNLSWQKAVDDSEYTYQLVVKDGKNVVYTKTLSDNANSFSVNFSEMAAISGKSLSFEIYATQEIQEKGQPVILKSSTLKATAKISDIEAPTVVDRDMIFADVDYIEGNELWINSNVADPISNTKGGDLTLYGISQAFADNVKVTAYELVVDGQVIKGKVDAYGDATFKMAKNMTTGEKTGYVYAVDAAGNRSEGIEVHFDVDDKVAPKLSGKLGVVQSGNDFDLSWQKAVDDSEYVYQLVVKDGKNVVYSQNISADITSLTVNLNDMANISGKSLSFELYASQQIFEKGQPVILKSSTLKASAKISDWENPEVVSEDLIFADADYLNQNGSWGDLFPNVADPIKNGRGVLTLYDVDLAFTDNVGIASYELHVDNKTFKTSASKMAWEGGYTSLNFSLSGLSSGNKQGYICAVDAAGNTSQGINVYFDVD